MSHIGFGCLCFIKLSEDAPDSGVFYFALLFRVAQNSTKLPLCNHISMTQLRNVALYFDSHNVTIYWSHTSLEMKVPPRWVVKFMPLILECPLTVIQSQSRGVTLIWMWEPPSPPWIQLTGNTYVGWKERARSEFGSSVPCWLFLPQSWCKQLMQA